MTGDVYRHQFHDERRNACSKKAADGRINKQNKMRKCEISGVHLSERRAECTEETEKEEKPAKREKKNNRGMPRTRFVYKRSEFSGVKSAQKYYSNT